MLFDKILFEGTTRIELPVITAEDIERLVDCLHQD